MNLMREFCICLGDLIVKVTGGTLTGGKGGPSDMCRYADYYFSEHYTFSTGSNPPSEITIYAATTISNTASFYGKTPLLSAF